jgi:hypothetical protein
MKKIGLKCRCGDIVVIETTVCGNTELKKAVCPSCKSMSEVCLSSKFALASFRNKYGESPYTVEELADEIGTYTSWVLEQIKKGSISSVRENDDYLIFWDEANKLHKIFLKECINISLSTAAKKIGVASSKLRELLSDLTVMGEKVGAEWFISERTFKELYNFFDGTIGPREAKGKKNLTQVKLGNHIRFKA